MSIVRSFALLVAILLTIQSALAGQQGQGAAPASRPMTNDDVIAMVKSGLSEGFIAARIRQEEAARFDLSVSALVQLKAAGVSEAVLSAMVAGAASRTPASPAATPATVGDAASSGAVVAREPGIYIDRQREGGDVTYLEPAVFTQAKTGGLLGSVLTYGLYKAKWKAVLRSPQANIRTSIQRPTFYFHFEQRTSPFGSGAFAGWLASAASPNEFVLAQMIEKRRERELIVGEFGALGSSSGVRSADTVPIKVERLAPGVYRVVPDEDLGPGEFCFFYAAGVSTLGTGAAGKLFDFGVDEGH